MICSHCHGTGKVQPKKVAVGKPVVLDTCPTCHGNGKLHCCEGDQEQPKDK